MPVLLFYLLIGEPVAEITLVEGVSLGVDAFVIERIAMMALNMLRRWLNGQDIASEHGWIEVVESMTLSSAL